MGNSFVFSHQHELVGIGCLESYVEEDFEVSTSQGIWDVSS
jgi:hypothetical protein